MSVTTSNNSTTDDYAQEFSVAARRTTLHTNSNCSVCKATYCEGNVHLVLVVVVNAHLHSALSGFHLYSLHLMVAVL